MADALNRVLQNGPSAWTGLSRGQQMLLLVLGLLLPVVVVVGSQWVSDGQYVPLFASLSPEDGGAIVAQLKASKTPYRVGGNGDQILVPADRVSELRLRMAVQGLPLGGGVGFEVFDKPALGVSDFAQRLNYQRALQGELSRTIGQLREVARARVHLVLPQPSLFSDRERPASASVFVKLQAGTQLGREQIRGIVHLVASSVEGLSAERVTVVDTSGRVLSMGGAADTSPLSPRRLEIKTAVEEGIERRIQSLLDTALGAGHAVARVSAQINFDQIERTEEKFDQNAVPRQKTRSTESSKGRSATPMTPPAAPDANAPQPNQPTPANQANQNAQSNQNVTQNEGSRESESVTYEVGRIVARTLTSPGEIQRLSVSVILSTPTKVTQPADKDKKEVRAPAPRAAEEIEKIRKVVMGVVGFNETRGDQVTVVEMPFDTSVLDRERGALDQPLPPLPPQPWITMQTMGIGVVAFLAMAAVLWLVLRGFSRQRAHAQMALSLERAEAMAPRAAVAAAPGPIGQMALPASPAYMAGVTRPAGRQASRASAPLVSEELMEQSREREDIRDKASSMANAEPDATAQLLRAWLVKKRSQPVRVGSQDGNN